MVPSACHGRAGGWHFGAAAHGDLREGPVWKDAYLLRVSEHHYPGVELLNWPMHSCQFEFQGSKQLLALFVTVCCDVLGLLDKEYVFDVNGYVFLLAGVHLHGARQDRRPARPDSAHLCWEAVGEGQDIC